MRPGLGGHEAGLRQAAAEPNLSSMTIRGTTMKTFTFARQSYPVLLLLVLFGFTLILPSGASFSTTRWGRDAARRQASAAAQASSNTTASNATKTTTTTPARAKKAPEWHKWYTLAVIIILFILMAIDWRSTDCVAFMALIALWNAGILSETEAMAGFSNSAMLTVGVLFVVVHGVDKSQVAPYFGRKVFGIETGERWALFRMMLFAFFLSAFLNNTPIVALLMPLVRDWARTRGFHPSTFLIPLSYATASGGMITLIGTSTNLVITGLVTQAGLVNIGFFDLAMVALPSGILSVLAMVWLAPIMLPRNDGLFREIKAKGSDIVTEVKILPGFSYIGKSAGFAMASMGFNIETLIKIRRPLVDLVVRQNSNAEYSISSAAQSNYNDIFPVDPAQVLLAGDVLFLGGGQTRMLEALRNFPKGMEILGFDSNQLEGNDMHYVEVILSDKNPFVGDVVAQTSFSSHYGVSVLAFRRKGRTNALAVSTIPGSNVSSRNSHLLQPTYPQISLGAPIKQLVPPTPPRPPAPIGYGFVDPTESALRARRPVVLSAQIGSAASLKSENRGVDGPLEEDEHNPVLLEVGKSKLHVGDCLLLLARDEFLETWSGKSDFIMVNSIEKKMPPVTWFDYIPLLFFAAMILVVAIPDTEIDMLQASMFVAALLIFGGWVDAKTAVNHIEWDLLFLIGCMISLSRAMSNSGLADEIAGLIASSGISNIGILFVMYIITCILTEVLSNNGCAGLIFPIAISISKLQGISYMPMVVIIMFGSTTSFLTPIGYQCNMMVWAPGGYKFTDFTYIGIVMNIIYTLVVCLLTPAIWPMDDARYIMSK